MNRYDVYIQNDVSVTSDKTEREKKVQRAKQPSILRKSISFHRSVLGKLRSHHHFPSQAANKRNKCT